MVTRFGTALIILTAALAPAWFDSPKDLPDIALGSSFLFYLERVLAVFVILFALFVVAMYGVGRGQLPTRVARDAWEWPEDVVEQVRTADEALADQVRALEERVASLEGDLDALSEHVAEGA